MTQPCIRRPNSIWTHCGCPTCRTEQARMAKLARNGHYHRPGLPVDEAWQVLDSLIDRGWTPKAIGSATGTGWHRWHGTIREYMRTGRRRVLSPSSCVALTRIGEPTDGQVGAYATRRRLQALSRIGWDLYRLSDDTGIGFTTLAAIRAGKITRTRATFHTTIADAYTRLCMTPGPSTQAVQGAIRKSWVSPMAWDDIDDPREKPRGVSHADKARRQDVDEAVVIRVLDGEVLPTTIAEKNEIMRRWKAMSRSERALCARMGWKDARYGRDNPEAGAA